VEPISISRVSTYLACPLKYKFEHVDKIPKPFRASALAFGGSVHAALEWYQKERLAGKTPEADAVISVFDADWYAQNLDPLIFGEKDSKESLAEKGRALLKLYVEQSSTGRPEAVEAPFEVEVADPTTGEVLDLILRGRFDLLEEGETLVDTKTAARTLDESGLQQHLQLSAYALAYLLLRHRIPKLRLDQLLKTKQPRIERHETARTVEDLAWTAHLIRRVAGSIAAGHFYPSPSWRCSGCEYLAHCQAWRGD
jgi:putative RecB family exonuclease